MDPIVVDNVINVERIEQSLPLARVYQPLNLSATIKKRPEDFIVEEQMSVDFSGAGEHCWLRLQKRNCNTDYLAGRLADFCGVKKHAVAYAGLKDRHAVTSQWFSVHLPGKSTPDWEGFIEQFNAQLSDESIMLKDSRRHHKKLQRGALRGNAFTLTCRELSRCDDEAFTILDQRCRQIAGQGLANYFGPQRFGHAYGNLEQAARMFSRKRQRLSRHKRSLYLSAARSWLFNLILSERVKQGNWNRRLQGDVFMLDGRSACFVDDGDAATLAARLAANEIHPTAALWGEGDSMVTLQAAELEQRVIDNWPQFRDGLVDARLKAARRACRLLPGGMQGQRQGDDYIVRFTLPAGSYATEVMAEIFSSLNDASRRKSE